MKLLGRILTGVVMVAIAGIGATVAALEHLDGRGIGPRRLAAYVDQRQQGHGAMVTAAGNLMQQVLLTRAPSLDEAPNIADWPVGAHAWRAASSTATVRVGDMTALRQAVERAAPGDIIELLPGLYRIASTPLALARPGTPTMPITLRAANDGVRIEVDLGEAVVVSAPFWHVEGLHMRGVCPEHGDCEHAFHVVGNAHHFIARGNILSDFNAHFKVNGIDGVFPDDGIIENNTLDNANARRTDQPVTPIDLVAASRWHIRGNVISDFIKQGGDQISYGAYAKGGGIGNQFERNIVWCERKLRHLPGARVGLSFGGGGSGPAYCRDKKCVVEQEGGVMQSNLIIACSDDGIYLNNAARTTLLHNSVVGTEGVSVRFAGSSADLIGNLIRGPVRSRDGALVRDIDNLSQSATVNWFGAGTLNTQGDPVRRRAAPQPPSDLCGTVRPVQAAYGAIESLSHCTGRNR